MGKHKCKQTHIKKKKIREDEKKKQKKKDIIKVKEFFFLKYCLTNLNKSKKKSVFQSFLVNRLSKFFVFALKGNSNCCIVNYRF